MIGSMRGWVAGAGRVGLVIVAIAAFATFALPWFTGSNGEAIIGLDLAYVRPEMPDGTPLAVSFFLEVAPLPAYVTVLLAFTVGVRRRWARFVAAAVVLLAAAFTVLSAVLLLVSIEDYWQPQEVQHYRLFALVTAVLALLLLIAAGTLAAGLRHLYHGFVGLLLLGFVAFQFTGVALLAGQSVGTSMTVVPWVTGVAYLLAAGCAAVVSFAPVGSPPGPATPTPVGVPPVPSRR